MNPAYNALHLTQRFNSISEIKVPRFGSTLTFANGCLHANSNENITKNTKNIYSFQFSTERLNQMCKIMRLWNIEQVKPCFTNYQPRGHSIWMHNFRWKFIHFPVFFPKIKNFRQQNFWALFEISCHLMKWSYCIVKLHIRVWILPSKARKRGRVRA